MKFASILFSFLLASVALFAEHSRYFRGDTNKSPLKYKSGEEMLFTIFFFERDKIVEGQKIKWTIESDDGASTQSGEGFTSKSGLKLARTLTREGFARVVVTALDDKGNPIRVGRSGRVLAFNGGAGADIEKITNAAKEPLDFDAFWQRQLDAQAKIPMKCERKYLSEFSRENFDVWQLSIECLGKPVKAFLSIPKHAKDKSLPMQVYVHGYGVSRLTPPSVDGQISLSILRHSYEPLREKAYYENLKKGELRRFGLSASDHINAENSYFKFMIMRDLRAIEYAKKNVVAWNGKDLRVRGTSMGGFQAIFIAALDNDISFCEPNVPWLTDMWGTDNGLPRIASDSRMEWTPDVRYFDSTFAVKRVKCPLVITARLGDYVCPPVGIMTLYNNARVKTTLDFAQNGRHVDPLNPKASQHYILKKN